MMSNGIFWGSQLNYTPPSKTIAGWSKRKPTYFRTADSNPAGCSAKLGVFNSDFFIFITKMPKTTHTGPGRVQNEKARVENFRCGSPGPLPSPTLPWWPISHIIWFPYGKCGFPNTFSSQNIFREFNQILLLFRVFRYSIFNIDNLWDFKSKILFCLTNKPEIRYYCRSKICSERISSRWKFVQQEHN